MTEIPEKVIRIVGLVNGGKTAFDGQYVVSYDPGRNCIEPLTRKTMSCFLVTTPYIDKATRYDVVQAHRLWTSVDPRKPVRPDGKDNAPLTAFTIEIMPADGAPIPL